MKKEYLRPAIAMIELIFSIVIMGIVLLSAPMLISVASKSTSVALQQEGINEAATRINMILTYDWDDNSINVPCGTTSPILHANGANALKIVLGPKKTRIGVPANSNSHTFDCSGLLQYNASATMGQELPNTIDDIDDFNNVGLALVLNSGVGGKDYIENPVTTGGHNVLINTAINYVDDAADYDKEFTFNFNSGSAPASTTNIKAINVTLTSSSTEKELEKNIVMHAFSCNIGSYTYYRKAI